MNANNSTFSPPPLPPIIPNNLKILAKKKKIPKSKSKSKSKQTTQTPTDQPETHTLALTKKNIYSKLPLLISLTMSGDLSNITKLLSQDPSEYSTVPGFTVSEIADNIWRPDGKNKTAISWASYLDEYSILTTLLSHNPKSATISSHRNETPLHYAALSGSVKSLNLLLSSNLIDINCQNIWDETPLHLASAVPEPQIIQILLEHGADSNITDLWGRTPYQVAQQHGEISAVKIFQIEETNHSNSQNAQVVSSQDLLHPHTETTTKCTPLSKLLEYPGDPESFSKWINDPSIDIHGRDMFNWTALHKLASWNRSDMLTQLLEKLTPAQVNSLGGPHGQTALHAAIELGAVSSFQTLIQHPKVNIQCSNKDGLTPFQFAQSKISPKTTQNAADSSDENQSPFIILLKQVEEFCFS